MNQPISLAEVRQILKNVPFPEDSELLMTLYAPPKAETHGIPRLNLLLYGKADFLNFNGQEICRTPLAAPALYYCAAGGYQWLDLPEPERESISFCYFGTYIRIAIVKRTGERYSCHTDTPVSQGVFLLMKAIEKLYGEKHSKELLLVLLGELWNLTVQAINGSRELPHSRINWHWTLINDYLREHRCENFSRNDVAKHFHLSPGSISRLVKENAGMEYSKLQLKYKLEFACELLQYTMLTVEEISDHCGFHYSSYFNRCFKKFTGDSPCQWRKKHPAEFGGIAVSGKTTD